MDDQAHDLGGLDPNTFMSSQRTALSLERTSMGADRTQMAVLRTSLSLIGFGFTIYKFFEEMGKALGDRADLGPPARNFGIGLVALGIALLVASLVNNYRIQKALRERRKVLFEMGLLRRPPVFTTSPNAVASVILLLGGLLVMLGIVMRTGPFG